MQKMDYYKNCFFVNGTNIKLPWVKYIINHWEKINYKVREHSLAKVPVMLVVGKREAEERAVAQRRLGGKKQECGPE